MSVGILAHLLGKQPFRELAAKVGAFDFSYVQLALSKAISDVDVSLGKISPGLASEIGGTFADNQVRIAVLGCYASLIDLEEESYRHNVDRFKEHLRHARQFGAPIVATEVGKPADLSRLPEYWERLDHALEELVEEAERWGVTIGLEAAQGHLIDSPETMAQTLERFPSSCIGVVVDPCNLMNADNFIRQDEVIQTAFDLLGPRIVSAHAKDLRCGANCELIETAAGLGELNYPLFWKLLEQHKPRGFVTLEAVTEAQCVAAARFVRKGRVAAAKPVAQEGI
ncbi:MAG: sugar phosphate isomerase/epimerase [Paenibacillaceae bacterium]|uniref:Sugar phosphate isomerase/epimerase n=1 Tax=Paenibacillus mellifer TaxID=2937794 RepID=A0A9X1XXG3_9BACL|nr:sugar phosphate isomerase/epimerase [Paenibacillus mellifer]MBW4841579.1 sugar phosphate isomerase/epimerase [Paenibacillaceae bacterium]MCK8486571.1 sugar phosphate isomerase/epimerase [Paenibacillus mellifer]